MRCAIAHARRATQKTRGMPREAVQRRRLKDLVVARALLLAVRAAAAAGFGAAGLPAAAVPAPAAPAPMVKPSC
jgi:hypothetical protein